MNYYEHHIGDYAEATGHLSFVEDAAYSRMIRKYYATERPLPVDVKAVQRLVGARSREERLAVESVLHEFFELQDDGWHQRRCDLGILKYHEGEPEREVKKANEDNRLRKHREERSRLFKVITDAGQHAPWNIAMNDLRAMVKALQAGEPETKPETGPPIPETEPATAPATPATATQTPDTRHQTPDTNVLGRATGTRQPERVSIAGAICVTLKAEGIGSVNPGHPDLLALIDAGAEVQNFVAAARSAKDKGKGFAYVLGTVKGQLQDARQLAATGVQVAAPLGSSGGQARAQRMAEANPGINKLRQARGDVIDMEVRDVTARSVG